MASLLGRFLGTISGGKEMKVSEQLLFDKVIGFRGVTDGVGATTLVFNTAVALADTTNMNICVVDTHILYPVLNQYLGGAAAIAQGKDWFDFVAESDNLNDIAYATNYRNVYLVSFHNRGIADMFTGLDNEKVVTTMFDTLTKFFDIVLVDLSHEPTYISSISAMKCNKIYTIFEPSLGCLSSLKDSINNMVNLGVPPYKLNKVIENKHISDVNTGIQNVLNAYHFKLLASIPFSVDIARPCVLGKKLWGMASNKAAITEFNKAMDILLDDVLQANNQVQGYIRNEEERTDVELGEAPRRVDNEPFDYEEPTGARKPFSRRRNNDVAQRGVGIDAEAPTQQPIMPTKTFGNGIESQGVTQQEDIMPVDTGLPVMDSGMPDDGLPTDMGMPDDGMPANDMIAPNTMGGMSFQSNEGMQMMNNAPFQNNGGMQMMDNTQFQGTDSTQMMMNNSPFQNNGGMQMMANLPFQNNGDMQMMNNSPFQNNGGMQIMGDSTYQNNGGMQMMDNGQISTVNPFDNAVSNPFLQQETAPQNPFQAVNPFQQ